MGAETKFLLMSSLTYRTLSLPSVGFSTSIICQASYPHSKHTCVFPRLTGSINLAPITAFCFDILVLSSSLKFHPFKLSYCFSELVHNLDVQISGSLLPQVLSQSSRKILSQSRKISTTLTLSISVNRSFAVFSHPQIAKP